MTDQFWMTMLLNDPFLTQILTYILIFMHKHKNIDGKFWRNSGGGKIAHMYFTNLFIAFLFGQPYCDRTQNSFLINFLCLLLSYVLLNLRNHSTDNLYILIVSHKYFQFLYYVMHLLLLQFCLLFCYRFAYFYICKNVCS